MSDIQQTHYEGCWKDHKHHACALARIESLEAELKAQQKDAIPEILFDSYTVLQALDKKASTRTSPENVCDVLDALVRIWKDPAIAKEGE